MPPVSGFWAAGTLHCRAGSPRVLDVFPAALCYCDSLDAACVFVTLSWAHALCWSISPLCTAFTLLRDRVFFFFKLKNPMVENSEGNSKDRKRLHLS